MLPVSAVSFRFIAYKLRTKIMLGSLHIDDELIKFYCIIPQKNAKLYKNNPDLLVPKIEARATLKGIKVARLELLNSGGEVYPGEIYTSSNDRFLNQSNEMVLDSETGLIWAREDSGTKMNWESAKNYCNNYSGGGFTDWRLPTQVELKGLYVAGIRYENIISRHERYGRFKNRFPPGTLKVCRSIKVTREGLWAQNQRGTKIKRSYQYANRSFKDGNLSWNTNNGPYDCGALPVRDWKNSKLTAVSQDSIRSIHSKPTPGCFIATAAYGSSLEPHVMTLRQFRDRWLVNNSVGLWFVEKYYRYSPPTADLISRKPVLKTITRFLLFPLVVIAGAFMGNTIDLIFICFGISVLSFCLMVFKGKSEHKGTV